MNLELYIDNTRVDLFRNVGFAYDEGLWKIGNIDFNFFHEILRQTLYGNAVHYVINTAAGFNAFRFTDEFQLDLNADRFAGCDAHQIYVKQIAGYRMMLNIFNEHAGIAFAFDFDLDMLTMLVIHHKQLVANFITAIERDSAHQYAWWMYA